MKIYFLFFLNIINQLIKIELNSQSNLYGSQISYLAHNYCKYILLDSQVKTKKQNSSTN